LQETISWNGGMATGVIMTTVEVRARVKEQKQAEKQAKLVYRGVAYLKG